MYDAPMASPKISTRQREILTFIEAQMRDRGYPPSVREIGEAVGLDPDAAASRRRGTGVVVLLGGLALAALIAVSGRRRRDPVATATAEVVWGPPQGPRLG